MILEHDAYMLRPLPNKVLKRFPDVLKLDSLDPYLKTYNKDLARSAQTRYNMEFASQKRAWQTRSRKRIIFNWRLRIHNKTTCG